MITVKVEFGDHSAKAARRVQHRYANAVIEYFEALDDTIEGEFVLRIGAITKPLPGEISVCVPRAPAENENWLNVTIHPNNGDRSYRCHLSAPGVFSPAVLYSLMTGSELAHNEPSSSGGLIEAESQTEKKRRRKKKDPFVALVQREANSFLDRPEILFAVLFRCLGGDPKEMERDGHEHPSFAPNIKMSLSVGLATLCDALRVTIGAITQEAFSREASIFGEYTKTARRMLAKTIRQCCTNSFLRKLLEEKELVEVFETDVYLVSPLWWGTFGDEPDFATSLAILSRRLVGIRRIESEGTAICERISSMRKEEECLRAQIIEIERSILSIKNSRDALLLRMTELRDAQILGKNEAEKELSLLEISFQFSSH